MFTIIKDKYIRCFVGLFVFIFLSVATCNSYASVCFLPGGDCGETNDDLAFWCEPDDVECNKANGTKEDSKPKPEDTVEPKCTTSCTPEDGHRTCTTDSKGCPIVGKECLDDKYLTLQACKNDNNGADCKLVGTCYEVRTAPKPSCSSKGDGWYDTCPTWAICSKFEGGCYKVDCVDPCDYTYDAYGTAYGIAYDAYGIAYDVYESAYGSAYGNPSQRCAYDKSYGCYRITKTCQIGDYVDEAQCELAYAVNGCIKQADDCYRGCSKDSYSSEAVCKSHNRNKECEKTNTGCWMAKETVPSDCPDDKICFKFNYTCNGETCSKDFFNYLKYEYEEFLLEGYSYFEKYSDGYIDYYNPIPKIDMYERLSEFDGDSEGILYYYDDETGKLIEKQERLLGNKNSSDILDFTMLTLDKKDLNKNEVISFDYYMWGNFNIRLDRVKDGIIDGITFRVTHSPDDDKTLLYTYYFTDEDEFDGFYKELTKTDNIVNVYADMTAELTENPTRNISIIAKCNKFSEIDCSKQPGGEEASYMSNAEQACYNANNLGCIAPSLQYTENGEIKDKTPASKGQIYTDSAGNEYVMTASGLQTLKFVDASFVDNVTPTDKFMYTFTYVPLGTEYTATIIPIKEKMVNGSGYQLFREFVFEDLREYSTVDFNTPRSGNVIYTLDKDNLGNDLTLYPVIDYEYRIFAYLNDDREATNFGSGSADSLITAITINGPVMQYYNRSIPNSLPDRSPFIDMPVDNSACNQYGGEKDIVATKGSCGYCYLQSANAGSDSSGDSLNLVTNQVSIGNYVWGSARIYDELKENFFSWPIDDDIYDGIYVTNEYYSGETPYPGSCELKIRTLYSYFTNEDALMNAGPVYNNGMTKLVSFNNTASGTWSIWGTYYPVGAFAVIKYQETRSKDATHYFGIKALRARCLNYGSSGLVDGVYHRYNGFNCDEMY